MRETSFRASPWVFVLLAAGCEERNARSDAGAPAAEVALADNDAEGPSRDAGASDVADDLVPTDAPAEEPFPDDAAPPSAPTQNTLTMPIADVWPAVNRWSPRMEEEYSEFVAGIGRAVAARRCGRLDVCLRNPTINTLYDSAVDGRLNLDVDCADLPYILRGYFAFKRRLPFGFTSVVRGVGQDPRYMLRVRPYRWMTWQDFRTPRQLFREMSSYIHSGMYRVPPEAEDGDFYPPEMSREGVVPGTAYYDPNGHVLVVIEVRPDGSVYLIDGHPDGSLTYKRFGEAFAVGTARMSGGFKNFRAQTWDGTTLGRATNAEIPRFDGASQWTPATWAAALPAGTPAARVNYHTWVRARLAAADAVQDPVQDLHEEVQALCRDVTDRVIAVDAAVAAGIQRQPHPSSLPWNIYGTSGDWETWSTPSRDARLKAAVQEIHDSLAALPMTPELRQRLRDAWNAEAARPDCRFAYTRTDGVRAELSLDDVLDRLWNLSFDPYHCVELRWGAPEGSAERAACRDEGVRLGWYARERRLRQQIERTYGVATPLELGPETAPEVDPRPLLREPETASP